MAAVPYRSTFFRLLGFLKPYKLSLVVSILLACGSQAAQIAIVWVIGGVIDKAIQPHDSSLLRIYILTIVGLGVVKAGLMVARRLISGRQALGVELDLRNTLYARLVKLSFRFYDTHQTGQLMSRATVDLQGVRFFLGYGLIFLFQNILVVVSVTIVLFFVQWKLALIALAIVPFLIVLAYRYSRLSHPTLRDVQQKLADVATVAQESIVGVHVVKAFAQEPAEEAKFRNRSEAVFGQTIRANRQRAFYVPLISFVPMLAQSAVLLFGATMVQNGTLQEGKFVSFNLFLGMLVMPLRSLGMWVGQAQRATAAGERIFQVIDEPQEVADSNGAIELPVGRGDVRFEGVSFEYLDGRPVLHDVDLEVPAGRTIALIGHTGSGKTTLTSLVPRFYDVTAGRVVVDGHDVRDLTLRSLRRTVGVISQDPFLFSATVRENIAFGAGDLPQEAVEQVARAAQAHEFIERLPQGYDTVIGERGITLSGGQRQRLAIARAILRDSPILILDEPTANLDVEAEAEVMHAIDTLIVGRTVLMISHRLSTLGHVDEIVVLQDGRIAERGSYGELKRRGGIFARLLAEQHRYTAEAAEVVPAGRDALTEPFPVPAGSSSPGNGRPGGDPR
jgi:ATP-binding cassette, subfamily B, bacterial